MFEACMVVSEGDNPPGNQEKIENVENIEFSPVDEKNSYLQQLNAEINGLATPDDKLQHILDFMASALNQKGTPHFKSFWVARSLCPPLFKEHLSPSNRSTLWTKFTELSKEARRLKDVLDEQSAFAAEQIEIAIHALENEINQLDTDASQVAQDHLIFTSRTLERQHDYYAETQAKLDRLNAYATRVNALRKELIKTEMRMRKKNQFFQRLSAAGDRVFPLRKELIKDISERFVDDVNYFVSNHFSHNTNESPFFLREEIKSLQNLAKALTLNAHAFNETRLRLSESWEKLRTLDKERKKERAQQRAVFKEHLDVFMQQLNDVIEGLNSSQLNNQDASKKINDISTEMRKTELGREEIQLLRDKIHQARQLVSEKIQRDEDLRLEQERERLRQKQQQITALKNEVEQIITESKEKDIEAIASERDAFLNKLQELQLSKQEKQEIERQLVKPLRDLIADKKEKAIMSLSADARQAIDQLKELLKDKMNLRQEINDQLEAIRKASGGSGLDFEKAMTYRKQLDEAKESLDKVNLSIQEIEEKISQFSQ